MPPKRKRTDDPAAEATSSTRGTRSSTRQPKPTTTAASKKSATKKNDEVKDQIATLTPPAKKSKTTKSETKSTAASRSTKQTAAKGAAASSSKGADRSGAAKSSPDDDIIARKNTLPEALTPSTINELPPKPAALAKAVSPPPAPGTKEPYAAARSLALFKVYAESEDPNVIGPEGFERLCTDAKIPLEGAAPLILSWQLGAKEMGKVTEAEWRKGTESLQVSNLHALSLAVHDLENLLIHNNVPSEKKSKKEVYDKTAYRKYCEDRKDSFRKLYAFCFGFAKPEQSKNIEMETVTALWSVLLVPQYPLMSEVIEFINGKPTTYKAANKDLWNMMMEFCESVNPNLSDYESDGAWPTLLDDFVQSKKGPTANGSGDPSSTSD